jgi:hypothetical protein
MFVAGLHLYAKNAVAKLFSIYFCFANSFYFLPITPKCVLLKESVYFKPYPKALSKEIWANRMIAANFQYSLP